MRMRSSETSSAVTKYSAKKSDIHLVSARTRDCCNECWMDKWTAGWISLWETGFNVCQNLLIEGVDCWRNWRRYQRCPKTQDIFAIDSTARGWFLHSGKRWKMNCGVAPLHLNFVSRFPSGEISPIISSSTFMFHKWRAPNHIFSDNCVFCLPMVLTPLMTINTECAFYSTF